MCIETKFDQARYEYCNDNKLFVCGSDGFRLQFLFWARTTRFSMLNRTQNLESIKATKVSQSKTEQDQKLEERRWRAEAAASILKEEIKEFALERLHQS
jgi:hypothetical protein